MLSNDYLSNKVHYNLMELIGAMGSSTEANRMIKSGYFKELWDGSYIATHTLFTELNVPYSRRISLVMETFGIESDGESFRVFIADCMTASGQWVGLPLTEEQHEAIFTVIDDYMIVGSENILNNTGLDFQLMQDTAEHIESMENYEAEQFLAAIEHFKNFGDALNNYEDFHLLCESTSQDDIDEAYCDMYFEGLVGNGQETDLPYHSFNEEQCAREMAWDYNEVSVDGSTYIIHD